MYNALLHKRERLSLGFMVTLGPTFVMDINFLCMILGKYGQNFSHTWHDISVERDGTIKVQRGYPSALEYQEVLPHGKRLPHIATLLWIALAQDMSKNLFMEWQEPYH